MLPGQPVRACLRGTAYADGVPGDSRITRIDERTRGTLVHGGESGLSAQQIADLYASSLDATLAHRWSSTSWANLLEPLLKHASRLGVRGELTGTAAAVLCEAATRLWFELSWPQAHTLPAPVLHAVADSMRVAYPGPQGDCC